MKLLYEPGMGARLGRGLLIAAGLLVAAGLLFAAGCGSKTEDDASKKSDPEKPEVTLNVLVVDSPTIEETAGRRWSAEGMGAAKFTRVSAQELADADYKLDPSIDVVVYPVELMPDLVSRSQLLPIPKKHLDGQLTNRRELLRHQQKYLLRYGQDTFSLPLGDVGLKLVYNQKVFDELGLSLPETWVEYGEVAKQLRDAGYGVQEPFDEGWASRLLLSRVAAYVRSRGKVSTVLGMSDMQPLLDSEPFTRVLSEMKAALGDSLDVGLSPSDVYANLLKNEVAMGLTWPSKHFAGEVAEPNGDIAFARLPGANEWYDHLESKWMSRDELASKRMELLGCSGLAVSVNNGSAYISVSLEFATWLCSKTTSTNVLVESPQVSMFRATHLGQPTRWTGEKISPTAADQYGEVVREISESEIVFLFPRIPGQAEYLHTLDEAVKSFALGDSTAQQALSKATEQWDAITDRLDRKEQIKMLRLSEGYSR